MLLKGESIKLLLKLQNETKANAIYWNEHLEPYWRKAEDKLQQELEDKGVKHDRWQASYLFHPDLIKKGDGTPFKVFSHYWRSCLAFDNPRKPLDMPESIDAYTGKVNSQSIDSWTL